MTADEIKEKSTNTIAIDSPIQSKDPSPINLSLNKPLMQQFSRVNNFLDYIDISSEGHVLLGSSELIDPNWDGALCIFKNAENALDLTSSCCGTHLNNSAKCGLFLNSNQIVVADDSGVGLLFTVSSWNESTFLVVNTTLIGHDDAIECIDPSSDGLKLLTGSRDKGIKLWDVESQAPQRQYDYAHNHTVTSVGFRPAHDAVFHSTSLDENAFLWDTRKSAPALKLKNFPGGFSTGEWLSEHIIAFGYVDGSLGCLDVRMDLEIDGLSLSKYPIYKIAPSFCSNMIAVIANDNLVRLIHFDANYSLSVRYTDDRHGDLVRGLSWHPEHNNILLSCGWDKKVYKHVVPCDL